ncbi:hypothetical protein [Pseudogemmobacter bohemicus]|uniref:hypothetical protein n=1 Tax=Pseudogemmobacter bohemicus TaxID=2250708 RepID=UPI000DD46F12|nr:hypothetical protein [Pseudogemmobacter bohemicus]
MLALLALFPLFALAWLLLCDRLGWAQDDPLTQFSSFGQGRHDFAAGPPAIALDALGVENAFSTR